MRYHARRLVIRLVAFIVFLLFITKIYPYVEDRVKLPDKGVDITPTYHSKEQHATFTAPRVSRLRSLRVQPLQKVSHSPNYTVTTNKEGLAVMKDVDNGEWFPRRCKARQKVAIIVPYRDRKEHLVRLMNQLHPFLQRQQLHYKIFVVEQEGSAYFNKGALMNTAFLIANQTFNMDCVVFHDVDLLPLDDRNFYGCHKNPRHLSVAIDVFNFTLPYHYLLGGVLNMKTSVFKKINGYSNLFWGWGGEDDSMFYRMRHNGFNVIDRDNYTIARYEMMKHKSRKDVDQGYDLRYKIYRLQERKDMTKSDGLTTLETKVISVHNHILYTHLMVDVSQQPKFKAK